MTAWVMIRLPDIGSSPFWFRPAPQPTRNASPFFGACAGEPELLVGHVKNLVRILEGVREPILALGEFEPASFEACLAAVRHRARRPDAAFWYAVSWAEGRRPE